MSDLKDESALHVNKGVHQPSDVNNEAINKFKSKKKSDISVDELVNGIRSGNITLLSRAITIIESSNFAHQKIAAQIVEKCLPHSGNSIRIGITGVPGVGKSTFIESFGKKLTSMKKKLAVLAVDPSSEKTKGSILGDKTRMEELSSDPNAYIRPSPSSGSLGGVARKTRETIILCEAAGFDVILVETVGVGQSEIAVHGMVDFFLLLLLAGAGDELQGIKRGIMEMADAIAINKADGDNIEKARLARAEFINALHLFPLPESGWSPKVFTCSGLHTEGLTQIWNSIIEYLEFTNNNGYFKKRRLNQAKYWMYETINEGLKENFYNQPEIKQKLEDLEDKVVKEQACSFKTARHLLESYFKHIERQR